MMIDDWCRASMAIGEVHLGICNKYPRWPRILEHLPCINITWEIISDIVKPFIKMRRSIYKLFQGD